MKVTIFTRTVLRLNGATYYEGDDVLFEGYVIAPAGFFSKDGYHDGEVVLSDSATVDEGSLTGKSDKVALTGKCPNGTLHKWSIPARLVAKGGIEIKKEISFSS